MPLKDYEKASIDDIKKILKYISKGYKVSPIIYETIKRVAIKEVEDKNRVVLIKRDPNVERGRIQGAYVHIVEGETIEIHPASVGGYGADFDGDQMAIFVPISKEAQEEVKKKMITTQSFEYINAPNFTLSKEMNIGLFTLTFLENTSKKPKLINNVDDAKKMDIDDPVLFKTRKGVVQTTAGRVIFNSVIPSYTDFQNKPMDSKSIKSMLDTIMIKNKDDFAITVDKLCKMGFEYATSHPQTISLDMLLIPQSLYKLKEQLSKEKDIHKQADILSQMDKALLQHLKEKVPGLYIQIASGAAKGGSQIRQIMVAKGLINNAVGELLPVVGKSLNDGYTPEEYMASADGSRKGIIDRAVNTAYGGYAYRKMVYSLGSAEADITNADCGTKRGMKIKITPALFRRMSGRYIISKKTNKIERLTEEYIGQIVEMRSPMFCKSRKICRTCYGDLIYQIKSKNVGILAAQACASLSEKIMKSFHCIKKEQLIFVSHYDELKCISFETLWDSIDSKIIINKDQEEKDVDSLYVYDKDKFVKVKKIIRHLKEDSAKMMMVRSNNGDFIISQDNHPNMLSLNNSVCNKCNQPFSKPKKLGYWTCKDCNVQPHDVKHESNNEYNMVTPKEYVKSKYFSYNSFPIWQSDNRDNNIDPYLLGMFLAEGSFIYYNKGRDLRGFTITQNDGDIKDNIKELIYNSYKNKDYIITENSKFIKVYDRYASQELLNNTGRYSWQKSLNYDFINYSDEYLSNIVCGIIDGDGSFINDEIRCYGSIELSSLELIQQLHLIFDKLNIKHNISVSSTKNNTRHQCYIIKFYPSSDDYNVFKNSIKMKNQKFPNKTTRENYDSLITYCKEIQFDENEYVYDLTTETGTLTVNGMWTHNTGGAVEFHKINIINELSTNVGDAETKHLERTLLQKENDLYCNTELVSIKVDKNLFQDKYKIKVERNRYHLALGYFTMDVGYVSIPATIEQKVELIIPTNYNDDGNKIVLMYGKGDHILHAEPATIAPEKVAAYLDELVAGKSPWTTPESLFLKFYNNLEHFSMWDTTHLEVIIGTILRNKKDPQKPARLVEPYDPETHSIKSLPSQISWAMGLAYENIARSISAGMISDDTKNPSSIEQVLFGEPLSDLSKEKLKQKYKR